MSKGVKNKDVVIEIIVKNEILYFFENSYGKTNSEIMIYFVQ